MANYILIAPGVWFAAEVLSPAWGKALCHGVRMTPPDRSGLFNERRASPPSDEADVEATQSTTSDQMNLF
ncbi:hypothetical protein [Burkholderia contaminans]|uniref:hypothetical protein n=1 Tax=Burkholderia contaminans TaxID=488447 RepID=UPI001589054E|nr:hypothetical protein [Burkholderia contaminans]